MNRYKPPMSLSESQHLLRNAQASEDFWLRLMDGSMLLGAVAVLLFGVWALVSWLASL